MTLRRTAFQQTIRDARAGRAPLPFYWAAGIEDTFITEPWPATGRTLDEYELIGHYAEWAGDVDRIASLGVGMARYGIPWHRVQPAPDVWDWSAADGPLERLLERGVEPVVDLVHYAAPPWLAGAFGHPDYPERVAEYARRVAERYRGRVTCYTPLNEPRITAWYCGRLGWWPPHDHGTRGFLRVMRGVCRGMTLTIEALRASDPENVIVHVDPTDHYEAATPDLRPLARHRQEIVYLALDLILGRVGPEHPLWAWCLRNGLGESDLRWFLERPVELDVCGLNLYPMFSRKLLRRGAPGSRPAGGEAREAEGRVRTAMPYASGEIVDTLVRGYHERYPDLPLMITETAARGPVARRRAWLNESVAAVRRCRAAGLPLIGYTWWPMLAMVAWAYRQGTRPVGDYLESMGLWDLRMTGGENAGAPERVETALVGEYRAIAAGGAARLDG